MRYYEIMHTKLETPEQREWRLFTMYGKGPMDEEFDEMEMESAEAKAEVDRAKARKLDIEALTKLIDSGAYDLTDLERDFPWPMPRGGRSLTEDERLALWVRGSIIAGKALPLD